MPSKPTRNPLNIYLGVVIVMAVGLLIVALLAAILMVSQRSQKTRSTPQKETTPQVEINKGTEGAAGVEKIEAAPLQQIREATPEP